MMNTPDGKMKIKLPKTLNKSTRKETSTPYQFSASNWSVGTTSYQLSVKRRGITFICSIFAETQCYWNLKVSNAEGWHTSNDATSGVDPHALLCNDSILIIETKY